MTDKDTIRERIEQIDAILADGVRSSRQADRSTEFDLEALEKERNRLQRCLNAGAGGGFRKVVFRA